MQQTEILDRLQTIFDDVFIDELTISPQLSSRDIPEWDSLQQITLTLAVEQVFQIRFAVGEAEETRNVGEFAALIERKLNAVGASPS